MQHAHPGSWSRGLLAAVTLAFAALLSACGSGGGDTPPPPVTGLEVCDSGDFQTVLNAVPPPATSPVTGGSGAGSGKVRIHYHRPDAAYGGWQTYVYNAGSPGESLGGWPGADPSGSDTFGAYWDVPVTSAAFNFIVHKGNSTREPSGWSGKSGTDE
jgi:hypothetical protein